MYLVYMIMYKYVSEDYRMKTIHITSSRKVLMPWILDWSSLQWVHPGLGISLIHDTLQCLLFSQFRGPPVGIVLKCLSVIAGGAFYLMTERSWLQLFSKILIVNPNLGRHIQAICKVIVIWPALESEWEGKHAWKEILIPFSSHQDQ